MGVILCVNVNRCVHMFVSVCSLCVCVCLCLELHCANVLVPLSIFKVLHNVCDCCGSWHKDFKSSHTHQHQSIATQGSCVVLFLVTFL